MLPGRISVPGTLLCRLPAFTHWMRRRRHRSVCRTIRCVPHTMIFADGHRAFGMVTRRCPLVPLDGFSGIRARRHLSGVVLCRAFSAGAGLVRGSEALLARSLGNHASERSACRGLPGRLRRRLDMSRGGRRASLSAMLAGSSRLCRRTVVVCRFARRLPLSPVQGRGPCRIGCSSLRGSLPLGRLPQDRGDGCHSMSSDPDREMRPSCCKVIAASMIARCAA